MLVCFSHRVSPALRCLHPHTYSLRLTLQIYNSGFVNLYYGTFFEGNAGDKPISKYKLICAGPEERVVGLHIIGECTVVVVVVRAALELSLRISLSGFAEEFDSNPGPGAQVVIVSHCCCVVGSLVSLH